MGVFGSKSTVGVYLDADSLSVLNAQDGGAAAKVLGFSSSAGLKTKETDAAKNQLFTENIKKVFKEAAVRSKSVSLAVPAEGAMIRYFDLPNLPKKEEKNAVRFEAQKYVPFDMKELYYDYDRYPDSTGKKIRIVFFACKKQWVDQISAMIMLAGAKVDRVELVSQSLVRAFCRGTKTKSDQVEAMIFPNDDQCSAELILFRDTSVLFTRHVAFTQDRGSITTDVPFFVSEIRISFDYFYENFRTEKIGKIHLVSASNEAAKQTLQETLQRELSVPVDLVKFPQVVSAGQIFSTGMGATYGLVLGDFLPDKVKKINLAPSEGSAGITVSWEDEKKQLQNLAVKVLFGVAAVLAGAHVLLNGAVNSKNAEVQRAYAEFPPTGNASIQDSLSDLQTKQTQLLGKAAFGSELLDRRVYFTHKMNELVKILPAQARLSHLRYDDNVNSRGSSDLSLRLEGYVFLSEAGTELTVINKLVKQLTENKEFMTGLDEIKIVSTKRATVKALPATKFVLDCVGLKKGV